MLDVASVLIFLAVLFCSFLILKRRNGLPPGPLTLPLIGSYFFLKELRKRRTHQVLSDAAEVYGKIFSFRIGPQLVVVLHGRDVIHEALVNQSDVFSDRPTFLPAYRRFSPSPTEGIVLRSYSQHWKTLRRFTLQTLRDFGVGKTSIEEKIAVEIGAASNVVDDAAGKPMELTPVLQKLVGNVIYGIVFGKRFDFDDPDFDMIRKMSTIAVSGQGSTSLNLFLPRWITWIFARQTYKEATYRREGLQSIKNFIFEQIKQHEDSYDENNIRDFVDLYIQVSRDPKGSSTEVFTDVSMFRVILELFIAGAETTYNTLDWAFLFMSEYPEIQEKCFKEITDAVGDKYINYADRVNLTYVEATILEVQRLANIVPTAVQHSTNQDTTLLGYNIPNRTIVLPNLYSSLMDPKYWNEPSKFKPERFIDNNGKLIKHDALIPFGTGPRVCLGEPLARMELFLVFANMLQKYKFERESDSFRHTMAVKLNQITSAPTAYKLRIERRLS